MNILCRKEMKQLAAQRLSAAPQAKKILLIYAGVTLGLAALSTALSYLLSDRIGQTGGLGNMGTRAFLSTLDQFLPLVQQVLIMCLSLGFTAAMLRIARGQYCSHRTLKLGFDRFWPLLRLNILRSFLFIGAGVACVYMGTLLYMVTPLSDPLFALLEPVLEDMSSFDPNVLLSEPLYDQMLRTMIPCLVICLGLYALVAIPMWYRYRLADYILIDNPGFGALVCLRQSKLLIRKNRLNFFKIDLSFWYYYLILELVQTLGFLDLILIGLGIALPVSETVAFFGFYGLSLAAQLLVFYLLKARVDTTYALAYESLLPEKPKDEGVVLGNIFQL